MMTKTNTKNRYTKVTTIPGKKSNMFLVKTDDVKRSKKACLSSPKCPSIIKKNFPKKYSKKKKSSKKKDYKVYYLSGNTGITLTTKSPKDSYKVVYG